MRTLVALTLLLVIPGCAMGYWPNVEGPKDARYTADVQDCQTATQSGATQVIGGAVWLAMASKTDEGRAKIDACMTQKGYRVTASQ